MHEACPCNLDYAAISVSFKENIPSNKEDNYEHQRMPDYPAIGNGHREQKSAEELIDEIRQQGS